jgi:hypothetical protein
LAAAGLAVADLTEAALVFAFFLFL